MKKLLSALGWVLALSVTGGLIWLGFAIHQQNQAHSDFYACRFEIFKTPRDDSSPAGRLSVDLLMSDCMQSKGYRLSIGPDCRPDTLRTNSLCFS